MITEHNQQHSQPKLVCSDLRSFNRARRKHLSFRIITVEYFRLSRQLKRYDYSMIMILR